MPSFNIKILFQKIKPGLEASFGKAFQASVRSEEMLPRNRMFRGQSKTPWS
ncbi:hypothetical protein LEP1GSC191_1494 [Leptospira borgpetersenii serovar Mini str. 201000851]|uniref:Uncharacterized protein n=1 Tax=Leptospira borgpetersenii str. 200801926 TaxID=1193009 RepID=A0ABN0I0T0_LEPBO|nr:hypothetical protein LEP1GSC128_1396 [Leptospira borgpetersenii str. 200801926]ENO64964.1 hypothetical protein LEP1GSC191_1494 [Leptospira borgpetersenii serovar Mini str. 201000851]